MILSQENNMPLISVIVPVFNTSAYLQRCIDSLRSQTYQNIELIFVDDGSADDSVSIIQKNMGEDSRIVLITQTNSGPSAARNRGLDNSHGSYIMFCDSDDTVEENWCEYMLGLALQYPRAWITCGTAFLDSQGNIIAEYAHKGKLVLDKSNYWLIFKEGVSGHVWNKVFLSEVIDNNRLRFDESIKRGEDVLFNLSYLKAVDCIVASDRRLYHYYQYKDTETLTNMYHKEDIDTLELLYKHRYPFIAKKDRKEFQQHYWKLFSYEIERTFKFNQEDNWFEKIQLNQRIIETKTFQSLLAKFGKQDMHPAAYIMLRKKLYLGYWIFQKMSVCKNSIKRTIVK